MKTATASKQRNDVHHHFSTLWNFPWFAIVQCETTLYQASAKTFQKGQLSLFCPNEFKHVAKQPCLQSYCRALEFTHEMHWKNNLKTDSLWVIHQLCACLQVYTHACAHTLLIDAYVRRVSIKCFHRNTERYKQWQQQLDKNECFHL